MGTQRWKDHALINNYGLSEDGNLEKGISSCDIFVIIISNLIGASLLEEQFWLAENSRKVIVPCIQEFTSDNMIPFDLSNIGLLKGAWLQCPNIRQQY